MFGATDFYAPLDSRFNVIIGFLFRVDRSRISQIDEDYLSKIYFEENRYYNHLI